jgi:hypothetical protein
MRDSGPAVTGTMYLNCPRCWLSIISKPDRPTIEHCPRCMARSRIAVRLFASTLSSDELYAARSAPEADWADARHTVELCLPRV